MLNIQFALPDLIELSIYIFYIYFLIILAIVFKPNILTISALILYVYYISWDILSSNTCHQINFVPKVILSAMYTLGCVIAYIVTYYIYWYYRNYIFLLFFAPFAYFLTIKTLLYILKCNPYSNINYAFGVFQKGIHIFTSILHHVIP